MSTTFPLPSSPHCAPTTTMLGMSATSRNRKMLGRIREQRADRHGALMATREIVHADQDGVPLTRTPDDEGPPGALLVRVRDRLLERPPDDIAGDGPTEVAQA